MINPLAFLSELQYSSTHPFPEQFRRESSGLSSPLFSGSLFLDHPCKAPNTNISLIAAFMSVFTAPLKVVLSEFALRGFLVFLISFLRLTIIYHSCEINMELIK